MRTDGRQTPPRPQPGPAGSPGPRHRPRRPAESPALTDSTPVDGSGGAGLTSSLNAAVVQEYSEARLSALDKLSGWSSRALTFPHPLKLPSISSISYHGSYQSVSWGTPGSYPPGGSAKGEFQGFLQKHNYFCSNLRGHLSFYTFFLS